MFQEEIDNNNIGEQDRERERLRDREEKFVRTSLSH